MSECAHHSSCPWLQKAADIPRSTSARSAVPLPNRLLSPGCVVSSAAVEPSRPGLTTVARFDANACRLKPQSVGELTNSQDQIALEEIWALAGAGANTKIAAATAVARNSFIGFPRVVRLRHTLRFPRLMACDTNPK